MHLFTFFSAFLVTSGAVPLNELHQRKQMHAMRNTMSSTPFRFPLPNGFPNITSNATLHAIEIQAGGPLPSGSGGGQGSSLSSVSAHALQAVAFNELFEVAFFTELLHNVTQSVPGYELGEERAEVIAALTASQAQEELHLLSANQGLKASGFAQVKPCAYNFPVNNFSQAIRMADDFSSVLIGVISDLLEQFRLGGDLNNEVINLFCAVLGQEGQQDGFFRLLQSKVPNANPFLTSTTLSFLFNHIKQNFIAEGSCTQNLNIPSFHKLTPLETPAAKNTTVQYSTTLTGVTSSHKIVYISGQLEPVVVSISNITLGHYKGVTTFTAAFPFAAGFSKGLTVAALVQNASPGSFQNASQVAASTLAGPGLIQVE